MNPPTTVLSSKPLRPSPVGVRLLLGAFGLGVAAWMVGRRGFHPHAPDWSLLAAAPTVLPLHIVAALIAVLLGALILAAPKGRALHRTLGWTWVVAMATVAVSSFFIRELNPGRFSWIHLLSGWTIIALPMAVAAARRRRIATHRRLMTGLFTFGLIVAGGFTFVPGRLMWRLFLG